MKAVLFGIFLLAAPQILLATPITRAIDVGRLAVPSQDIELRKVSPSFYVAILQNGEVKKAPDLESGQGYCELFQAWELETDAVDHSLVKGEELVISEKSFYLDQFNVLSVIYLLYREGRPHVFLRCLGRSPDQLPTAEDYKAAVDQILSIE